MSIYADKVYDELDFISQATEPFMDNVENLFSAIPDRILLHPEDICESTYVSRSYANISMKEVIRKKIKKIVEELIASDRSKYDTDLCDLFTEKSFFTVESENLQPVEINVFTGDCNIPLYIVKKTFSIKNEEIMSFAKNKTWNSFRYVYFDYHKSQSNTDSIRRIKELCDIFNVDCSRTKNIKVIADELASQIWQKINNDTYRIRTHRLMYLIGRWSKHYIDHGDIGSYANLTRFKLMTHSGKAIYSLGEIE